MTKEEYDYELKCNEISKEDLFRKIDNLKIKIFDTKDALESAEKRIRELNKCNYYANEEIERLQKLEQEHQRINGELREENKRLREQLKAKD